MVAYSDSDASSSGSQAGVSNDGATSYQRDKIAVSDFDKDTGTDERYEVTSADRADLGFSNMKRTYDLHQTLDTDAIMDKRKHQAKLDSMEVQAAEQRLRHQEAEFNQRMAHADFNRLVINAAISKEVVDTIAERVCDAVKKMGE